MGWEILDLLGSWGLEFIGVSWGLGTGVYGDLLGFRGWGFMVVYRGLGFGTGLEFIGVSWGFLEFRVRGLCGFTGVWGLEFIGFLGGLAYWVKDSWCYR